MLEIPAFSAAPLWYAGLIWAMAMGWAASSYASNFSYRMPRNETPFGREPYCGDCDNKLTPKDLFPIFSYALTGGKCRHCGAQVPYSYFILELLYMPYVGLCYAAFGFGDMFVLMALLGMILQISAMMAWDDNYVSSTLTLILLMGGLLFGLLQGGLLLDGLIAVFFGLFGAIILHALMSRKPPSKDVYSLPKWIWVIAASAPWLTLSTLVWFIPMWLGLVILCGLKNKTLPTLMVAAQAPALLIAIWVGLLA